MKIKSHAAVHDGKIYYYQFHTENPKKYIYYCPSAEEFYFGRDLLENKVHFTCEQSGEDWLEATSIPTMYLVVSSDGRWYRGTQVNTLISKILRTLGDEVESISLIVHKSKGVVPTATELGEARYYYHPDNDGNFEYQSCLFDFRRPTMWNKTLCRVARADDVLQSGHIETVDVLPTDVQWVWSTRGDEMTEIYIGEDDE